MNKCERNQAAGFPVTSQGVMLVAMAATGSSGMCLFESLFLTLTFVLSAEQEKGVTNHPDLIWINPV